jgi:hypothetical protein
MISLLKAIPDIKVDREPRVLNAAHPSNPNKSLRTDFRVISGDGITEYDVSIIPIAAQKARTSSNQARTAAASQDPPLSISDLAKGSIQSILTRRAIEKKKLYGPLLNVPFAPLCITVGGMLENEAMESMEGWKEVVGEGGYRFMMRRISVFLARARGVEVRVVGGNNAADAADATDFLLFPSPLISLYIFFFSGRLHLYPPFISSTHPPSLLPLPSTRSPSSFSRASSFSLATNLPSVQPLLLRYNRLSSYFS